MRDKPEGISDTAIADAIERHWGVKAQNLEYAPVGAGSYHWVAVAHDGEKRFVTVDRVRTPAEALELESAYRTAAVLRDGGLQFVVAPEHDHEGTLLRVIEREWAVAVFPYIEGSRAGPGSWEDVQSAVIAANLVGQLHKKAPPPSLQRFSFAIQHRNELFDAIDSPWNAGPYSEPARTALVAARRGVEALLAEYDRLVAEVSADEEPWVISHGETHSANFIEGADGRLYLIDWDTLRLAPRERDLAGWGCNEDSEVMSAYRRSAGPIGMRPAALRLFHMWWDVSEICGYVRRFRRQHSGSLDDEASWAELQDYLQVESNWPELF